MNNQIISIAYSSFVNRGAFALLLGSGISRKSGIPTGWEITLKLIAQIATLEKQDPNGDLEQWYKNYFNKEPDYSDILEQLTNTPEERINLIRPFIEPSSDELEQGLKTPTIAHRQIARLVKDGYIKVIVTTNFDRLLENSLKDLGVEPTVISNAEHIENSIPLIHSNITIIKINGDYLDTKFLNIKSELEQYDPRMVDILKFIFENYGLITCGWSAQWDIALVNILKSANKFRYSNYFTYLNRINSDLNDLSNFRRGQLVKITDADTFFIELVENIEALKNGDDQHPLTDLIVLQRLKKYLVKEEHIISLHDLFNSVLEDFSKKTQSVNVNSSPTADSMKIAREQFFKITNLLLVIVINSSYWAKPYQHNLVINIIKRIAAFSDTKHTTAYAVWGKMVYFPALILRYACGISCIAGNNFKMLHLMSILEIQTKYKLEPFIKITENDSVIEKDHFKIMDGNNYHVPMSEFIFNSLKPYFKELIPLESDYELFINYYEFINSVAYLKFSEYGWCPMGRFAYKDRNMAEDVLKKAEKEGSEFELIKGGFYDSLDNMKIEFEKFTEHFKAVRHYYY